MIIEHSASGGQSVWAAPSASQLTGEVIVRLSPETFNNEEAMAALRASLGAELVATAQKFGFQLWSFDGISTDEAIEEMHASGAVEFADFVQPNYVLHAADFEAEAVIPNDPDFSKLWGLNNTGQNGGLVDADIDAPEAWEVSIGSGIVVGVIDSGVDYNHPDLINQIGQPPLRGPVVMLVLSLIHISEPTRPY